MEFGREKYALLIMKNRKWYKTEGTELPNQGKLDRSEKTTNTWGYWKMTPSNKRRLKKIFLKSISGEPESCPRKTILPELYKRDKYLGCPFRKILGTILEMVERKRKLTTMYKALHPKADVDRQYAPRRGEKELASIEDSVDASIRRLEDYTEKRRRLITAT